MTGGVADELAADPCPPLAPHQGSRRTVIFVIQERRGHDPRVSALSRRLERGEPGVAPGRCQV
jgi:hypothetical protein